LDLDGFRVLRPGQLPQEGEQPVAGLLPQGAEPADALVQGRLVRGGRRSVGVARGHGVTRGRRDAGRELPRAPRKGESYRRGGVVSLTDGTGRVLSIRRGSGAGRPGGRGVEEVTHGPRVERPPAAERPPRGAPREDGGRRGRPPRP